MTKRDRNEALPDRIRAGGAAHYYDGEQYAGGVISEEYTRFSI